MVFDKTHCSNSCDPEHHLICRGASVRRQMTPSPHGESLGAIPHEKNNCRASDFPWQSLAFQPLICYDEATTNKTGGHTMEMGKEIRRLRNNRGLTQEALAAALNVSAQTVSKW